MLEDRQLHTILNIINDYSGKEPLHRYLKNYFKMHHEMGSRDRRLASGFIYNYYRMGKALEIKSKGERIAVGNYICTTTSSSPLLEYCVAKFLNTIAAEAAPAIRDLRISLHERINNVKSFYPDFKTEDIFPCSDHLSVHINKEQFVLSMLKQPKVWIRVRKNLLKEVINELKQENILFETNESNPLTIAFTNATNLDKLKCFEKGYFEIQDWSSQQTINYFKPNIHEHWWDACAGSGGKSLMLHDAESSLNLTVSDSRASILNNLKERFRKAGIKNYKAIQTDLTNSKPETVNRKPFAGIIADVPCTGSGTWSRTPEWLSAFEEESINKYVGLQKTIVRNLIPYLETNHPLIYITCSVFKEENEDVVDWIKAELGFDLEESAYIKGCDKGADTMFAARLIKK